MELPEVIILEESPPPAPRRRVSSQKEDEKMLENTSLSIESQAILLRSIVVAKQAEIDKLSGKLEEEQRLRIKAEEKYNKLKNTFTEVTEEIGVIIEDLQKKKGEGDEDDTVKIEQRNQLSDDLLKRLDKSAENGVKFRGEINELNKQLESFIEFLHLPQGVASKNVLKPEVVKSGVTSAKKSNEHDPLPAKRVSIKPVRLVEELSKKQNRKKVRKHGSNVTPKKLRRNHGNHHAIGTSCKKLHTFYCTCGLRFRSRGKVSEHVKYYTKEWKFHCDMCPLTCAGANYLRQHYYLVHKIKLAPKFGCRECGGMLDTRRELLMHQAIMHKMPKLKKNNVEKVTMATDGNIQEIVLDADDDDDIQEIPVPSSSTSAYKRTMANELRPLPSPHPPLPPSHLEERQQISRGKIGYDGKLHGRDEAVVGRDPSKFHCVCGKAYNQVRTLTHHIKYQTWQWKFRCSECGLLFYGANYLRKHMVSTHKVDPGIYTPTFGCRRCGKLFIDYKQLVLHQRLAHRARARDPLE